jgi:hypothetical protein
LSHFAAFRFFEYSIAKFSNALENMLAKQPQKMNHFCPLGRRRKKGAEEEKTTDRKEIAETTF